MAVLDRKYGKDRARGNDAFISHALTGGSGDSNEIEDLSCNRPNQSIKRAYAMDNVKLAMPIDSNQKHIDSGFAGGPQSLKHSLDGASAVNEGVGAAGSVKHVIIPNH